jgi:hypothetical protein
MFSRIASQTLRQQPTLVRSMRVAAPSRSIQTLKSIKVCIYYGTLKTLLTPNFFQYTAEAAASGAGRNGSVSSGDLDFRLAMPKELGGSGNGQNPEQLFAMGYSGTFTSVSSSTLGTG